MNRCLRKCLALAVLACAVWAGTTQTAQAQAVIFPQEAQPGQASLSESGGTYTLSNALFSATFVKADGKLTFGGCNAMNLQTEENLFKIKLQNNDEVGSSAMTLGTVTVESLTGNAFAVRGVERFNGKQLVAHYTYGNLQIVWRAVLRDGSHYLRTELEITANGADVAMESITPMLYTVTNAEGNTAPVVVGNTRGAVIANNKIFAGLETPMGKQKAGRDQDTDNFTKDNWVTASFGWEPAASEIPAGVLSTTGMGFTLTADIVKAMRGYVRFTQSGSQTITFTYNGGGHALHLLGVDVLDPLTGTVLVSDYHYGKTGDSHSNNTFTLNIPEAKTYMVRYFAANPANDAIQSNGTITYSQPTCEVEVIRDLTQSESLSAAPAKAMALVPIALAPQKLNVGPKVYALSSTPTIKTEGSSTEETTTPDATLGAGGSANFSWATNTAATNWPTTTTVPAEVTALQTGTATNRLMQKTVTIEADGLLTTTITYTGGNHKLNVFGIDLVDSEGNVVSGDYHHGTMGGSLVNNVYTVIAPAGTYTYRIFTADISGDQVNMNAGQAALALSAITLNELTTGAANDDSWLAADFGAVTSVPAGITALNAEFTTSNIKAKKTYFRNGTEGLLDVTMTYTGADGGGNKKLYTKGVAVVDAFGRVISEDYHEGTTGNSSENNSYSVYVPAGLFTIYYYGSTKEENAIQCRGNIDFSLTPISKQIAESSALITDEWVAADWTTPAAGDVPAGVLALQVVDGSNVRNVTAANVRTLKRLYYMTQGEIVVEPRYGSGSKRLDVVGMEVLDLDGTVVASDYHFGYTGTAKKDNVFHASVPEKGMYYVRLYSTIDIQGVLPTNGTVNFIMQEDLPTMGMSSPQAAVSYNGTTSWWDVFDSEVPLRVVEAGCTAANARMGVRNVYLDLPDTSDGAKVTMNVNIAYTSGSQRLDIYGVDLVDATGNVVASNYHAGYAGNSSSANDYSFKLESGNSGNYKLRIFTGSTTTASGNITVSMKTVYPLHLYADATTPIEGVWSRHTTLADGKTWKVGAVVGLIAQSGSSSDSKYTDQSRRSFLAYSERERAVPWRAFPCYISWYELNINRNNSQDYSGNMTVAQCTDVVNQWKTNLFDKYNKTVKSFVWDDGWDSYGTWTFNPNFPNGFTEPNAVAEKINSNIGAWLGPVGGYGESGNYRRAYWNGRGGMQLSNPDYYQTFIDACSYMLHNYSFNFFKFDGISAQFSAVGPDAGTTGEENAEGIIGIERDIRAIKPDVFLNTTVGTWASPFWFQFTDAVWRQENDYDVVGNQGTDREKWITYRDNLVHQNFVTNSPFCPINTLMTHGFILSKFGGSSDRNYAGIVRELRCAFACGSGMVELYNDYDLTNTVSDATHPAGSLWKEIADCIDWQERNADVLPDIHWVGGDPWTGSKSEVYGWASWNGKKATLALRNGQASTQSFTTTLRKALEIPAHVTGSITFTKAFADQANLDGLTVGTPIDIDTELTLNFPASSVYVFDGVDSNASTVDAAAMNALILEAKRTLEHTGTGYPVAAADDVTTGSAARTTLTAAITTAQQQAYAPTQNDLTALQDAINAYKAATEEIQLLQDGYAYALTTKIGNAEYYLNYNAGTEELALVERPEGTAIPATATFVCHNVEGQTLLVNNAGKYLTVPTGSSALTDAYAAADNLLTLQKTAADFGVLRLANNAGNSWLTASTSAVGNAATATDGTTLLFHPMEYANLVTLRAPSTSDGNTYASLCLPFNALVPDGVTAYWGKSVDDSQETMTLSPLTGGIPANQAVVLISADEVTEARFIPAADEQLGTLDGTNLLKGVCESGVTRNALATTYVLNGNRTTGTIGFYRYTATNLPAYKAYLELTGTNAMGFSFDFGGEVTNLNGVENDAEGDNLPCYDLSGRRTLRPEAGGIYISGRKKFLVK